MGRNGRQNIMYLNKLSLAKNNIMGTYLNHTKAHSIGEVAEQHRNVDVVGRSAKSS